MKCKWCNHKFGKDESSIIINLKRFCNYDCATSFAKENIPKGREVKRKEQKKKDREWLQNNKPKTKLESEAQKAVNRYIRARDKFFNRDCPSCDKTIEQIESEQGWKIGGAWDAGHFKSRGAKKQLRFNLLNIWRQCKACNAGSGKFSHKEEAVSKQYEKTLIERIGKGRVELLNNNNDLAIFTIEYLQRLKKIFNKRARWYEKRR